MNLDALEASSNKKMFFTIGVPAMVRAPDGAPRRTKVLIDRSSEIVGSVTGVKEYRCEIGLYIKDVGSGERGTLVTVDDPQSPCSKSETWMLMESISDDGYESRWVATLDG
ncbi:MAG: hypothetical protein AAF662_02290 [Pseudomonadota bacterium]